jgi:VCBS repeat-containing protein
MALPGTKTTIKLATLTAAAKNDTFTANEDNNGDNSVKLNVLANDPGAAKLYSVWQPSGLIGATPASSNQLPVVNSATLASGATVTMNADGTITYNAGNGFNHLGAGKTAIDTFSYTARMANGALSIATVSVTITGVNDAASITGTSEGGVTEDGTLTTSGNLTVNDADDGENVFKPVVVDQETGIDPRVGAYGSFTFDDSTGEWTFEGDNDATQHLGAGDTAEQSLTVSSLDGTATQTITVTITGINDPASIGGAATGAVGEDGTLTAAGILTVSDADDGETGFQSVDANALVDTYGTFTFNSETGEWGYALNNTAAIVQNLNATDTPTDKLTVQSLDGTTHDIVVTVHGANEPEPEQPIGGGDTTGTDTGGSTTTTAQEIVVNNGVSFQNGKYHVTDYDKGDILSVSGYSYDGHNYTLVDAFGNDGVADSISIHFVKTGGGSGGQTGNGDVDVILDHYMNDFIVVIGSTTTNVDVA